MRARTVPLTLVVLYGFSCWAQEAAPPSPSDISKWSCLSPPTGDAWRAANRSNTEWEVVLEDGKVCARLHNPRGLVGETPPFDIPVSRAAKGRNYVLKVDDGWLIGYNAGEWGGTLWWFAPDGTRKVQISEDQVKGYVRTRGEIYALEGLAHLGRSKGKIIRIAKDDTGKWSTSEFVTLPEAPDAATLDKDGAMIVVTTSSLVRVSPSGEVKILLKEAFWRALYPTSIVLDAQGIATIGMRQGAARISSLNANPRVEWLIPKESGQKK